MRDIAGGLRAWGAALLAVGVVLVALAFLGGSRDAYCAFPPCGPQPIMGLLMFGGLVATTGLVLVGYGMAGPYARFVVAQVEPVEVKPSGVHACAACGKASAEDGRYCPHCGRERAAASAPPRGREGA